MTREEVQEIFKEVDERRKKYGDEAMWEEAAKMDDIWSDWSSAEIKEEVKDI